FSTADYFKSMNKDCFYPYASIVFNINDPEAHYHVPLLISGFGFSTYRGS
ncbi:MAG: hydroxyisourate hydrolase, partial [bacterium]|nr:hydroxyisourate hydrolase [bacterium]